MSMATCFVRMGAPCNMISNEVLGFMGYMRDLTGTFGGRFVIIMTCCYFFVKGSLGTFIGLGQLPYYRELGVPAAQYQIYGSIATTPWSMKALWGTLSDSLPIFGYPKGGYIVVLSIIGVTAFAILASVEIAEEQADIAAVMFFAANVDVSMVDLLCQGAYAAAMVAHPQTSSALVSWVWGQYHVGALLASTLVGPLADAFNPRIIFWIAMPMAAQIIIPTCLGYLGEPRLPPGQRCCHVDKEKVRSQPRLFALAVVMAICALGMAAVNLFGTQLMQSIYALSASFFLCTLAFFCLGPTLAKANLYMFLTNALYVSTDGALDYFYTAEEDCVPGGPNFSYTYYVTWANVVGSCCAIAGVALFQRTMSDWNFRPVFWVTTVVKVCAAMIDIVIVNRWNIAIGIPDEVTYMLGDAIVFQLCATLDFMPAVVLTSKLCPKSVEATVYALLAGFQNFGTQMSRTTGVAALSWFDIRAELDEEFPEDGCDFDNMPYLLFAAHFICPLLTVPLTFLLIPDANMKDDLEPESYATPSDEPKRKTDGGAAYKQIKEEAQPKQKRGSLNAVLMNPEEPDDKPQPKPKPQPKQAEPKPQPQPESEPAESEIETETQPAPESKPRPEPEPEPEPEA